MTSLVARLAAAASSLQYRVVAGTLLSLVLGISAVTLTAVRQVERDTLAMQRQRELGEAAHAADTLYHRVVQLQRALKATAALVDRRTAADPAAVERVLVGQPVLRVMFSDLDLIDAEGHLRLMVGAEGVQRTDVDLQDRDYLRATLRERRGLVSPPLESRLLHAPIIVFTEPLQDAQGVYGVLAGTLQLARNALADDFASAAGRIVLTDLSGRVIAGLPTERLLHPLSEEPAFAGAFASWQAAGGVAEPEGQTFEPGGALVSVAGVMGPEWLVWRWQPESALLAPVEDARRRAQVTAAVLVGALSLVSWFLLRRMLRPLRRVQQRARHLFDGTYLPHEGWPEVRGEIGQLAGVLHQAAVEHETLENARRLAMKQLESVMQAAPLGIAFTRDSRFELVNREFCRLFGQPEARLLGTDPRLLHASDADDAQLNEEAGRHFDLGEPYMGEWRLRHADGTLFWAQLRGRLVDPAHREAGAIWTVEDIGEQIARREQLEWSANHDLLTGLANRHAFEAALVRVFAARPRSIPAALVIIDLDHFKPVNDNAGHAAGDAVLKAVSQAILSSVRNSDLVARIGGDEFALVLERCPADVALRVAENVRSAVHAAIVPWGDRELAVGCSVGVAPLTLEMDDVASWMEAADSACYAAKAGGRGTVRSTWPPARPSFVPQDVPVS